MSSAAPPGPYASYVTSSYVTPSSSPVPFLTARSMLSSGMFSALAASIAVRSRALPPGSPPPCLAAIVISRISLVNAAPRLASATAFFRLICFHLLWPAMRTSPRQTPRRYDAQTPRCNLQLDRPAPPPVAFAAMSRSFGVLIILTCTVGACERHDQAASRAVLREAMHGVLAYPRSTLVSMTAGSDAGQLEFTSPDAVDTVAGWFRLA